MSDFAGVGGESFQFNTMNLDTPPNPNDLVKVQFTEAKPEVSWYRHESWKPCQFKRFRHYHTMSQDIRGFEFFTHREDLKKKQRAVSPQSV